MKRIAIISHSHPQLTKGGGEIAAYRHFEHLKKMGYQATFIGASVNPDSSRRFFPSADRIVKFGQGDFCFVGTAKDIFTLDAPTVADEDRILDFLVKLNADIYHFHHLWNIGVGTVQRLAAARPKAKLFLTAHEFTPICVNHGQMVKAGSNALCYGADVISCTQCVGSFAPIDFLARERRMHKTFALFDRIICPSEFMRRRLIDWGVAAERTEMIENALPDEIEEPSSLLPLSERSRRIAFFGQATPWKGLDVLVKAAHLARHELRETRTTITIHGATRESFMQFWPDIKVPSNVSFLGPYQPSKVISMMADYGWIVMPSTWWENSPVVIQEARRARTPMVVSDIGGMLEKTEGWGLTFRMGDAMALADKLVQISGNQDLLQEQVAKITPCLLMSAYQEVWEGWVAA